MRPPVSICLTLLLVALLPGWLACQNQNPGMPEDKMITEYEALPRQDGDTVTVRGIFTKFNPLPQFGPDNAHYRAGILLKGDSLPRLFLHGFPEQRMQEWDGRTVELTGVFYREERLSEGDPPHASRRSGSWMYDYGELKAVE